MPPRGGSQSITGQYEIQALSACTMMTSRTSTRARGWSMRDLRRSARDPYEVSRFNEPEKESSSDESSIALASAGGARDNPPYNHGGR